MSVIVTRGKGSENQNYLWNSLIDGPIQDRTYLLCKEPVHVEESTALLPLIDSDNNTEMANEAFEVGGSIRGIHAT